MRWVTATTPLPLICNLQIFCEGSYLSVSDVSNEKFVDELKTETDDTEALSLNGEKLIIPKPQIYKVDRKYIDSEQEMSIPKSIKKGKNEAKDINSTEETLNLNY